MTDKEGGTVGERHQQSHFLCAVLSRPTRIRGCFPLSVSDSGNSCIPDVSFLSHVERKTNIYAATKKNKNMTSYMSDLQWVTVMPVGATLVWLSVLFFLCHTLPCAQQQPQHRERLETFDDIIRSSLEVTGKCGRRVCAERMCIWCVERELYLQSLCIQHPALVCLHI